MTKAHNDAPEDCLTFAEHVKFLMRSRGMNHPDAAMAAWCQGPIKRSEAEVNTPENTPDTL
jgi:hypothetical protein